MAKIRVLYMATKKPRYNDFKIEKINLCLYFQITENVMTTISNIIESDHDIITKSQESFESSTTILQSLDIIAERLGEISINQSVSITDDKPNIAMAVQQYNEIDAVDLYIVGVETSNDTLSVHFQRDSNNTNIVLASAKVPAQIFKSNKIIYSFLFRNDILFQTGKKQQLSTRSIISSKILSVTVAKKKIVNLTSPVIFTFKKSEENLSTEEKYSVIENVCAYWDFHQRKCPYHYI